MTVLTPHQKQFVLGPVPVTVRPDWVSIRLADRLHISCCPKLKIARLQSLDEAEYYVLGLAIPADKPMTSLSQSFETKNASEIEDWTGFWSGKWALISGGCCWQDASGCLGFYYRHAGGAVWISSSPALLSDYLPNTAASPRISWQVTHAKGMDWIPAPFTTRENIYKLLPGRTINPRTGVLGSVQFAEPNNSADADVQILVSTLQTILANWGRRTFARDLLR